MICSESSMQIRVCILLTLVAGPMICVHSRFNSTQALVERSNFCFIENNNNHFRWTHKFNYRNFYCGENEIHFTFLFENRNVFAKIHRASLSRFVSVDAQADTDCTVNRYRYSLLARSPTITTRMRLTVK